jgi:hypothetical protein
MAQCRDATAQLGALQDGCQENFLGAWIYFNAYHPLAVVPVFSEYLGMAT